FGFYYHFLKLELLSEDEKPVKLTKKEIFLRGSIIALITTVPSLIVFVLVWFLLDNVMIGAISGAIVHFVAMGFSLKISKKLLVKK
ncbi:MAG: hypothetical protein ACE5Q9_06200, partial [Nitrosopumilus sp.]